MNSPGLGLKNWFYIILTLTLALLFAIGVYTERILLLNREITEKTVFAFDFNFIQTEISHYIFSIANSLLIGFYLAIIIPFRNRRNKYVNIILLLGLLLIAALSLGYFGVYCYFGFPFLNERVFISNGKEGTQFFISNLHFLTLIYASSFLIQSEID